VANTDFSRTMGSGHQQHGFDRSRAWFERMHIDLVLFLLILLLACCGLLILYSGSGQDMTMVKRQALHFLIGFVVLIVAAQFPPLLSDCCSLGVCYWCHRPDRRTGHGRRR